MTTNSKKSANINYQTLKLFWQHAWKHKRFLIPAVICGILFVLLYRYLPPLILSNILENISTQNFQKGELFNSFGLLIIGYTAVSILGGIVAGRLQNYFIWKLEMDVIFDIHNRIFRHLMSQSNNFHANKFGGSLVSQANKFASAYVRMADTLQFQILSLIMSFVFSIIILYPRAPYVAIALIVFSVIFIAVSIKITKKVRELNTSWAATQTKQTGYLADSISNVIAVKSFSKNKFESNRYQQATSATKAAMRKVMVASIKRELFFSGANTILLSGTLFIAVFGVVNYSYSVSTVFLVITYTGIIAENLWMFSNHALKNINQSLGDAYEMTQILNIKPSVKDPVHPEELRISRGGIEFNAVTFTHADNDNALFHNLDLSINSGEKIGLVGHSGSGKTTITSLILRFADIEGGAIMIDGQDISNIKQADLRSKITYVPQEPLMFHRSIAENIAYGKSDATIEEIKQIAKLANADEFISKIPTGYDTLVGERGVKLSGGQRQRVAIARAMIKDAPILVLDEATSALDSESEGLIQDALWRLMEGKTAIVIAHRLSTIQKMDRIVVLEEGNILEQGSHDQLLKAKGKYAELWAHQSGGFIED